MDRKSNIRYAPHPYGWGNDYFQAFVAVGGRTVDSPSLYTPFHATGLFLYPLKTSENGKRWKSRNGT